MVVEHDDGSERPTGPPDETSPAVPKESLAEVRVQALVLARSVSQLEALRKDADESESRVIRESLTRAAVIAGLLGLFVGGLELATPLIAAIMGLLLSAFTVGVEALFALPKLTGVEEEFDAKRRAALRPFE